MVKASKKQQCEDAVADTLSTYTEHPLTYAEHAALYEQAKRRGGLDDAMRSNPAAWLQLLPTELATGQLACSEMNQSPEDAPSQHAMRQKTSPQRKTARGAVTSETAGQKGTGQRAKPPSSFYVPIDGDNPAYSTPTYHLQDRSGGMEETTGGAKFPATTDSRMFAARNRSPMTKAPVRNNAGDRSPASAQRQIRPTTAAAGRKPNQQHSVSQLGRTKRPPAASTLSAARNKSTEWNAAAAMRPKPAAGTKTAGAAADARRQLVRPSQTTSATATRCGASTLASVRTAGRQLQRKVHGAAAGAKTSETALKKTPQTYAVRKPPLPYKGATALRRQTSAIKTVTESLLSMSSAESLLSQNSDHDQPWPQDYVDDYHDTTQPLRATAADCALQRSDIRLAGTGDRTRSRPRLAGGPPTPRPSVRQLRDGREFGVNQSPSRFDLYDNNTSQHSLLQQPSHGRLEAKSRSRSGSNARADENVAADELQFGAGTIRSHSSPSEHSFNSRHSHYYTAKHQQQQQQQQLVGGANRHDQVARKLAADNITATGRQHQHQQNISDRVSSASQTSVISCRHQPRQQTSRTGSNQFSRPPVPTASVSTVATDVPAPPRFVVRTTARRPVPVAPSGPAHHRRASRIPLPEPRAARPCTSLASTCISKCSSISSFRSEFNYARPMPTERIPFSKFGVECIVPLARMDVSLTPVDAFSIVGVSGHRKRFLPQTEDVPDDLWDSVDISLPPLSVVKAQREHGTAERRVSVVSSIVARSVAHTSTQTLKSVSLTTTSSPRPARKKTSSSSSSCSARKAHRVKVAAANDKRDDNADEDYSRLLVRLVQLLCLQAKLNASKSDNSSASNNGEAPAKAQQTAEQQQQPPPTTNHITLMEYLQKQLQQQQQQQQQRSITMAPVAASATSHQAQTSTAQPLYSAYSSSDQGAGPRVYRMGSSVTQVYSKNYPATTRSAAHVESNNRWSNAVRSKTLYFDHDNSGMQQSEPTKPWTYPSTTSSASFKPNFSQWHHYDNRYSRVSAYPGMRHGYNSYHRPSATDY